MNTARAGTDSFESEQHRDEGALRKEKWPVIKDLNH
jgi:hypothetical protein